MTLPGHDEYIEKGYFSKHQNASRAVHMITWQTQKTACCCNETESLQLRSYQRLTFTWHHVKIVPLPSDSKTNTGQVVPDFEWISSVQHFQHFKCNNPSTITVTSWSTDDLTIVHPVNGEKTHAMCNSERHVCPNLNDDLMSTICHSQ